MRTSSKSWLVLMISAYSIAPANAQKYAYPFGVESMGVAGAVGVDTIMKQSPNNRSGSDIKYALNILNGTNITKLVFFVSGYKSFLSATRRMSFQKVWRP